MGPIEHCEHHGLAAIRLISPDGAVALVTLHGAQVLSWTPAGRDEQLFLSDRAHYEAHKAIRGGIPVIFPQFGASGPLPRHGFARTACWALAECHHGEGFATATFALTPTPAIRAIWDREFRAELTVSVGGERLDVELAVENPSGAALEFTGALHTYLRVAEVERATLQGLQGVRFLDQAAGGREGVQETAALGFDGEIDRIYLGAPRELVLTEPQRRVLVTADGFPDVVIWNPWDRQGALLPDMAPTAFRRMLCVEAAVAGTLASVPPGGLWTGRQALILG